MGKKIPLGSSHGVIPGGLNDQEDAYIRSLGAHEIAPRADFQGEKIRPLGKELYAGAVDACGATVLANILPLIKHSGTVSACGLAAGMALPTTVAPFILRGVTLAGIESVFLPMPVSRPGII